MLARMYDLTEKDVLYTVLPLYHTAVSFALFNAQTNRLLACFFVLNPNRAVQWE